MKSKDYYIIKIRYYANDSVLKRWDHKDVAPKQHIERANMFNDFIWKLAKKVSNKDSMWWHMTYLYDSQACLFEYLEEEFGILKKDCEGDFKLFIPKSNEELFLWCKENIKNPYKILTKSNMNFYRNDDLKFHRNLSLEFTKNKKINTTE